MNEYSADGIAMGLLAGELAGLGIRAYRHMATPPMKQQDLATAAGVSQVRISRIEKGAGDAQLSIPEFISVALALRVSPLWLIELPAALSLRDDAEQLLGKDVPNTPVLEQLRIVLRNAAHDQSQINQNLNPAYENVRQRAAETLARNPRRA